MEYLCFLIRENNLEPMPILTASDLEIVVRRADKRMPPRPYGILETFYRRELMKVKRTRYQNLTNQFPIFLFFLSHSLFSLGCPFFVRPKNAQKQYSRSLQNAFR